VCFNILDQCSCVDPPMTNKLNHICIGPSIPPCSLLDSENFQVNIIKQKLQNRIQVLIEKKMPVDQTYYRMLLNILVELMNLISAFISKLLMLRMHFVEASQN